MPRHGAGEARDFFRIGSVVRSRGASGYGHLVWSVGWSARPCGRQRRRDRPGLRPGPATAGAKWVADAWLRPGTRAPRWTSSLADRVPPTRHQVARRRRPAMLPMRPVMRCQRPRAHAETTLAEPACPCGTKGSGRGGLRTRPRPWSPRGMASARQAAGGRPPAWLHGFGCQAGRSAGCAGSPWAARATGIASRTRLPAESSRAVGCHGHCRAIETARRQHRHGGGDCC